jgi:hypothetical protein
MFEALTSYSNIIITLFFMHNRTFPFHISDTVKNHTLTSSAISALEAVKNPKGQIKS